MCKPTIDTNTYFVLLLPELMSMQANWRGSCKNERSVQSSVKRKMDEERLLSPQHLEDDVNSSLSKRCKRRLLQFYEASLNEVLDVSIHSVKVPKFRRLY